MKYNPILTCHCIHSNVRYKKIIRLEKNIEVSQTINIYVLLIEATVKFYTKKNKNKNHPTC